MIAAFRRGLAIIVDSDVASLDLLPVHFDQSVLGALMRLILDIGETLRLPRLPIVSDPDRLYLAKSSEPITDVVFLEAVGQSFDKKRLAIARHQASHL